MATDGGTKAVVAALLANAGIAATKFLAFALTGISSMLAEAIHSVADAGNQVLLLLGGKQSRREATEEHPFGYGRERYIYAFIVSIVLFSVGGLFALYEAYHKFHEIRSVTTRTRASGGGSRSSSSASPSCWRACRSARRSGRPTTCAATRRTPSSSGTPRSPSCRSSSSRTWRHSSASSSRSSAVVLSLLTDNYYFDVAGTAMIGLLLVDRGHRPGHGDQEPAAR